MKPAVCLPISMFACLVNATLAKYYCIRWPERNVMKYLYSFVTALSAGAVLFAWGGIQSVSPFTILLAIAFGAVTALQAVSKLKAMELGSLAYSSVIISLSTLIPALSGCVFWNETISWPQIVGMVLMVICMLFSADTSGEKRSVTIKWLLFCGLAFLSTGAIGVLQKVHQSSDFKEELNAFLVIAFAASVVFSAIAGAVSLKREGVSRMTGKEIALLCLILIVSGVSAAVNNKLNLALTGIMPSAVFFPIVNGGHLVLASLVGVALFRERLTGKQWIGLTAGIVSVIFLCNPFG